MSYTLDFLKMEISTSSVHDNGLSITLNGKNLRYFVLSDLKGVRTEGVTVVQIVWLLIY